MPQRANITSVDALQDFRTQLLVFVSKARPALDEASGEVMRMRLWLENDQRVLWEGQLRKRRRKLEEAEAALFSTRLSSFQEANSAQQVAVHKARREVAEAEEKLRIIKRWQRDYENRTDPLVKQQEKLASVLATDVPNAVALLAEVIDTLQKYANVTSPGGEAPPVAASADAAAAGPVPGKEGAP